MEQRNAWDPKTMVRAKLTKLLLEFAASQKDKIPSVVEADRLAGEFIKEHM